MMNRKLADIVKGQKLVALAERETVQEACRYMWERLTGSVLVLDDQQRLMGIFTGRDAVRLLAEGKNAEVTTLGQAMTPNPITLTPVIAQSTDCVR
jgi:CBS domain-containing protein